MTPLIPTLHTGFLLVSTDKGTTGKMANRGESYPQKSKLNNSLFSNHSLS